jgi:hypothetical protein
VRCPCGCMKISAKRTVVGAQELRFMDARCCVRRLAHRFVIRVSGVKFHFRFDPVNATVKRLPRRREAHSCGDLSPLALFKTAPFFVAIAGGRYSIKEATYRQIRSETQSRRL